MRRLSESGTTRTAGNTALAAMAGSFQPVDLNACPVLHTGYPTGGCIAQLQTDLNVIQGNHLAVDGTLGSIYSQTYNAVIAFQKAQGLTQDGWSADHESGSHHRPLELLGHPGNNFVARFTDLYIIHCSKT